MTIKYRPAAIADLRRTVDYLSLELKNPKAANRLKTKILRSISHLKTHPHLGGRLSEKAEGCETEIRFLVVESQLVFYKVKDSTVEIVRILDGRTDYLARVFFGNRIREKPFALVSIGYGGFFAPKKRRYPTKTFV